jgi:uncharacterized protein with GYD domain
VMATYVVLLRASDAAAKKFQDTRLDSRIRV